MSSTRLTINRSWWPAGNEIEVVSFTRKRKTESHYHSQERARNVSGDLNQMRRCFQPWQFFVDHWINSEGKSEDFLMWVYKELEDGIFQVGYFMPDRTWVPDGSYGTRKEAAVRVNYLNGGRRE